MHKNSPLIAIVTGLEHSGTTYLSKLMTRHPKIDSGFECGVLLADSPGEFPKIEPFYSWMQGSIEVGHWGVKSEDMADICSAKDWEDMYYKIIHYSPVFKEKSSYILDKTPRYMPKLDKILEKVMAPCIVIYKDIFFQYLSYRKRGVTLNRFVSRYTSYGEGLSRAVKRFGDRILLVKYEELHENTSKINDIFNFIRMEFENHLLDEPIDSSKTNILRADFKYTEEMERLKKLTKEEYNTLSLMKKYTYSN